MSDRDFSIGDKQFKLSKVDPFKQFHIVRRLGPILGDIIPIAQKVRAMQIGDSEKSESQKFEELALLVTPIMAGLAKLSDEDADLVLLGLLAAVEMHQVQSNSWARVVVGKSLMLQDLGLPELMQIAGRAFAYNLAGFFASAHQTS